MVDVLPDLRAAVRDAIEENYGQQLREVARQGVGERWAVDWEPLADFSALPPRRWLYGQHYIRDHVTVTVAPGGLGKSALCLAECVAMATGRAILGVEPAEKPLRVWYWNGEDPLDETIKRVAALCMRYDVDQSMLAANLKIGSGLESELLIARQDSQGVTINLPHVEALRELFVLEQIDLAVIDPFVSSHNVTENDNMAINAVAKMWKQIATEANASVELIHHVRKGMRDTETVIEDARGAVSLIGAARSARVLDQMTRKQGEDVGISQPRAYFNVTIGKANLAPPPDKATWFHFESIPLGNGDSIGVVTPWQWPDVAAGVSAHDLYRVQVALRHGAWKASEQAKGEWVGQLIADELEIDTTDAKGLATVRKLLREWLNSGALMVEHRANDKGRKQPFVIVGTLVNLNVETVS